jgi:hypothetical protein
MADPRRPKERNPSLEELVYFLQNPQVAGYMAPEGGDGVVLNPAPRLDMEKQAVYDNETLRHTFRKEPTNVKLTPEQTAMLDETSYRNASDQNRAATIMARLMSGDPSGGKPSFEQDAEMWNRRNPLRKPGAISQALRPPVGKFDPEGSGYDYKTALRHDMEPEDGGHWGSVAPAPNVAPDAYQMLKGAGHDTWGKGVFGEAQRGSKVVKIGDRYYSVPNDHPVKR